MNATGIRPRRLAFFDDRHSMVYGAQENVLLLAEACRDRGHDVTFVTTAEGVLAADARARGLRVEVFQAPDPLLVFEREAVAGGIGQVARSSLALARYNLTLHRRMRGLGLDAVMASAVRPATMLLLAAASGSMLRRRPNVLLYAQNSTPLGMFATVTALCVSRICLIGAGAATTFPGFVLRLVRGRLRTLPSGRRLDSLLAVPRVCRLGAEHTPTVLTVASLTRRKGIDHVITAAGRLHAQDDRPVRVVVVGGSTGPKSDAYVEELRLQAESTEGVTVDFAGWQDDPTPFYAAADVFCLASSDEGLPGVLIEAMACGLPCVSTRAGSAGELVDECGAGHSVPIGDDDALTDALGSLIGDRARWTEASETGRRRVAERYGLDAFATCYEAVLADLFSETVPSGATTADGAAQ